MLQSKHSFTSLLLSFLLCFNSTVTSVYGEEDEPVPAEAETLETFEETESEEVQDEVQAEETEDEEESVISAVTKEQLEEAEALVQETLKKQEEAQAAYDDAAKAYDEASQKLGTAASAMSEASDALAAAQTARENAQSAYDSAKEQLYSSDEYIAAKAHTDQLQAEMQMALNAKNEAALAYEEAEKEYSETKANQTAKAAALTEALNRKQTTAAALENASAAYEEAKSAYEDAAKNDEQAGQSLTATEQAKADAEAAKDAAAQELAAAESEARYMEVDLTTAQENVASAEQALADAQAVIDKGSYGFFENQGAEEAMQIIDYMMSDAVEEARQIKLGDEHDATSLDLMKVSIEMIAIGNEFRTTDNNFPNLESLKVSNSMMAIAQANAVHSADPYGSSVNHWSNVDGGLGAYNKKWDTGENLAWGYKLPYDKNEKTRISAYQGWYVSEKKTYDEGGDGQTGHYRNLVDKDWVTTGFAISYDSNVRPCYAQEFGYGEYYTVYNSQTGTYRQVKNNRHPDDMTLYTVDEYYAIFMEYYNTVMNAKADAEAALADAQEVLEALNNQEPVMVPEDRERIRLAEQKLAETEEALSTETAELEQARNLKAGTAAALQEKKNAYDAASSALASAQTDDDEASAAYETALTASENADTAYTAAEEKYTSCSDAVKEAETALTSANKVYEDSVEILEALNGSYESQLETLAQDLENTKTAENNALNTYNASVLVFNEAEEVQNEAAAVRADAENDLREAKEEHAAAVAAYNTLLGEVVVVTDIVVSPAKADVLLGKTIKLQAEVLPSEADFKDITWKSSDPSIASVRQDGTVTAYESGTVTITAVSNEYEEIIGSAEITVITVDEILLSNVTVVSGTVPVLPETVTVIYSNKTTEQCSVEWDSISDSIYNKREGTKTVVNGNVDGTDVLAVCALTVLPAEIVSIGDILPVETWQYTDPADLLPETVSVTWSNNDTTSEPVSWTNVNPEIYNEPGTVVINGTITDLNGKDHEVQISVLFKEVVVIKLEWKTLPQKTEYYIGEKADVSGGALTVTYTDESQKVITLDETMITDFDTESDGEKTVTISYGGSILLYHITVRKAWIQPEKCYVENADTISVYEDKEPDFGKAAVHISYEDGTVLVIPLTKELLREADLTNPGDQEAVIVYEDTKICTLTVHVKPSITLKAPAASYINEEGFAVTVDKDEITVPKGTMICLTASLPEVTILYTTDGTEPDAESSLYHNGILIEQDTTLKYAAMKEGYETSPVRTLHIYAVDDSVWTEDTAGDVPETDAEEVGYVIPDGLWAAGIPASFTYDGTKKTAEFRVYDHKTLLRNGKDYSVKYFNNLNAGEYEDDSRTGSFKPGKKHKLPYIRITGKGNYSGTIYIPFSITRQSIEDTEKVHLEETITMKETRKVQRPVPLITCSGKQFSSKDMTITYLNENGAEVTKKEGPKSAGTYLIRIKGKGNYTGTRTVKLIIQETSLAREKAIPLKNAIVIEAGTEVYDGTRKANASVKAKPGFELTENDYTVTYTKNINAGTASVIVTGNGNYTGSVKKTFKISPLEMKEDNGFSITAEDAVYCKNGAVPDLRVTWNGKLLIPGEDYKVTYSGNKTVGKGQVTVTGKGNFTGALTAFFNITEKDLASLQISAADKVQAKKAYASVTLTDDNGKALKAGTDYVKPAASDHVYAADSWVTNGKEYLMRPAGSAVEANDIPDAGTIIKVTVRAKEGSGYIGSASAYYRIIEKQYDLRSSSVMFVQDGKNVKKLTKEYTGKPVRLTKEELVLTRKVKKDGKTVTEVIDPSEYEITGYVNNVKKGTAKVILHGIGEHCGGSKTVTFTIGTRKISSYWKGLNDLLSKVF